MSNQDRRAGILAVLQASGVSLATIVFLPGMFVRIGCQLLAATVSGTRISHNGFLTDLGGEVRHESGPSAWSRILVATSLGPFILGSVLLAPTVVPFTLLDVRPFASVSADPSMVVGHDTPFFPFLEALNRYGLAGFLALWFGVSCFYCSVPSKAVLDGAGEANKTRRRWSPLRVLFMSVIAFFRLLRGVDTLLMLGFAGSYLASGLLTLLFGWWLLTLATNAVF